MTIITQPITEKKLSKQKEPLVESNVGATRIPSVDVEGGRRIYVRGANRRSVVITAEMRQRARRISSLTTLIVFLTALLVFATGIIGGVYMYRQFTQYKLRHFRGWCSIPYAEPLDQFNEGSIQRDRAVSDLFQSMSYTAPDKNKLVDPAFFSEEFDIDIDLEEYERIEVPDFSHGRRGRFIHDFSMNKTGIIDLEAGRCFLLPLNRSRVLPPQSLYDLIGKMRSGYYDVDTEVVRESYRVVTPSIADVKGMGYYIGRECANLPSYYLEKVESPVFKRSAEPYEGKTIFAEFAGSKITELHIVNLHSAPGNK